MGRRGQLESVDVSIGVPPFEISGSFTPSRAERIAAWEILVELASRTTTAPLKDGTGSLTAAHKSLYELYAITREVLRRHGPDVGASRADGNLSLALISLRVLNDVIRPVLSTWHPKLDAYVKRRQPEQDEADWERDWPDNAACRAALNGIRAEVRSYLDALAQIAGTPDIADAAIPRPGSAFAPRAVVTGRSLPHEYDVRERMVRWVSVIEGGVIGWIKWRSKVAPASGPATGTPGVKVVNLSAEPEAWVDYVADLGDAFDPTMAVAYQLGRLAITLPEDPSGELPVSPGSLPRGGLLIMGGDEVYPAAGATRYHRQLVMPYLLGFEGDARPHDDVVAIPGNHDWMGGIEHFERIFLAPGGTGLGPRRAVQDKRWFVAKLPHGWWIWGIDTALSGDLGEAQVADLAWAAGQLGAGDRVILCTPVPLWQLRAKDAEQYQSLRQMLDGVLAKGPHDATIPLFLSGDSHYFAVYEARKGDSRPRELHVTSGGGGAFLHPTHSLAAQVPHQGGAAEFKLLTRWPRSGDSRAALPSVGLLRDRQSLTVVPLVAALHGLLSLAVGARWLGWGGHDPGRYTHALGFGASSAVGWAVLLAVLLAGRATVAPNAREKLLATGAKRFGWLHGLALAALFWITTATVHWLVDTVWRVHGTGRLLLFAAGSLVSGAVAYAVFLTVIGYLASHYRLDDNLAFAAVHTGRYKHFLRLHVDDKGSLHLYAIGIDPIGDDWATAIKNHRPVPPTDDHGVPELHYLWGCTI